MSLGRPILEMCKQGEIGFMPPEAGHYWGGISQLSLPPSQEKAKKWNGGNFENLENIRQLVSDKFEANGKTIDDKTKIKMENTAQFLGYYANTIPFWFTDRT